MSALPFQKELEFLLASKNPFSLLFSLVRIRELIEETGDALMNGIESAYFENTAETFSHLVDSYEKTGFYKVIYRYYEGNGHILAQK